MRGGAAFTGPRARWRPGPSRVIAPILASGLPVLVRKAHCAGGPWASAPGGVDSVMSPELTLCELSSKESS